MHHRSDVHSELTRREASEVPGARATPATATLAAAAAGTRRIVWSSLVATAAIATFGVLARWTLLETGVAQPSGLNIYFRLYALHELPFLLLQLTFVAATAMLLVARRRNPAASETLRKSASLSTGRVVLIAVAVVLAGVAIAHLVLHHVLLSMDEFSADFQARIFARDQFAPLVPSPWRALGDAITPLFVTLHEDTGRWTSQYLPVYALLKSGFLRVGLEWWLNPLLSAGSIVAMAAVARRLWPAEGTRPLVAVLLLATSTQQLVTSGTGYAMPAHLFLNLVWLWLYLRGDARSWAGALAVGVLAMGLHNPFPHVLFVAPFMFRLVRERRWSRLGGAALVYGAGALMWLSYLRFVDPVVTGSERGLFSLFAFPRLGAYGLLVMNLSLLLTWHAPVLGPLVVAAVSSPRRLDARLVDVSLGVLGTLIFYLLYPTTQGHGWGYRYAHQVLGNLCLLGAAGVPLVVEVFGARFTRRWLASAFALTVLVQLPFRLRDVERFVRPFAAGHEYLRSRDAVVVLLRANAVWYGQDLARNDPFLRYPVVVREAGVPPGLIEQLDRAFPGRVVEVSDRELLALGMTPVEPPRRHERQPDAPAGTR